MGDYDNGAARKFRLYDFANQPRGPRRNNAALFQ